MCNASNHSASCGCGFGPPYPGKVEVVKRVDWLQEIVSDETSFTRALKDLNFDTQTVSQYLTEYRSIVSVPEPQTTILEKLKALIDRREYRTEETTSFSISVPLFKLHSPTVDGAKVTYRESEVTDNEKGWLVKVFGIGMGRTTTMKVGYACEFVSARGECLLVFVPLVLTVNLVGVYRSGVLKSRGIRGEIAGLKDEWTLRQRSSETLSSDDCNSTSLQGSLKVESFPLSSHHGSHPAKYQRSWAFNTARTVELHLSDAFQGISIEPLARVKRERQLLLDFELPGKHDYRLRYNSSGLNWEV
jgi:hypothetical protein